MFTLRERLWQKVNENSWTSLVVFRRASPYHFGIGTARLFSATGNDVETNLLPLTLSTTSKQALEAPAA